VITALIIFIITYLFIGLRQIPRIRIDRPAGALVGAVLMVVFGVLTLDQAFQAIDMRTLLLLLGMMVITVYLRAAGFFELIADRMLSLSRTPLQLMAFIALTSGILSALFVNDTICLLYTPIILQIALRLNVNPVPYLLVLATSSNVGSVMTVTGNPQNMLIAVTSRISYLDFFSALAPVAFIGLAVCIAVVYLAYRRDLGQRAFSARPELPAYRVRRTLLLKTLLVSAAVLLGFSFGQPYSLVAAAGATALMLIGRVRTERILNGVDWTLLLFFAGLFIVMHGVEESGLAAAVIARAGDLSQLSLAGQIAGLSLVSFVLSNLVSNVPAVMLLKPLVLSLGGHDILWLALAMSSTLAGNFTLIASVANLIVIQQARQRVQIGFMEYFRVGWLITILTLLLGILALLFQASPATAAEGGRSSSPDAHRSLIVTSTISTSPARYFRAVLLCDTDAVRARGLSGFRPLKRDEAALFTYERPEPAVFWMSTVTFPIDIVFVNEQGIVVRVYRDCRPGSKDLYPSGRPVKWVIETAAGSGIREGDKVTIGR
jgi:Na+/H+ antiporter NhaD/arsenite permease-like protein/uncharacterized membrane protein (UPF0127 family)